MAKGMAGEEHCGSETHGEPVKPVLGSSSAEAAAIEALADQCELSISELVPIAIDHWYGEGRPSP
jgi:hypothetical protein